MDCCAVLAAEFGLRPEHVLQIVNLLDAGNTIPFIARYRKEATGSCDDQVLRAVGERLQYLRGLEKRKAEVAESVAAQGKASEDWLAALAAAATLADVEDLYRPFRPKRRTRASAAKELGLEPLADFLTADGASEADIRKEASRFADPEKGVADAQAALDGAMDILAERLSDDAALRHRLRALMARRAALASKAVDAEKDSVYRLYYDYSEPIGKLPGYRVLAVNRGEREGFLKVSVGLGEQAVPGVVLEAARAGRGAASGYREAAAADAWKRLIAPALERETRAELTERAAEAAIRTFGLNLRPLILQPPVKGKTALGFDPAYRTGCKLAVVDPTGKVLDTAVIYPTPPHSRTEEAARVLKALIAKHGVEIIAVGNGTASKESELFVASVLAELDKKVSYMMVSEAGASVYSASPLGAQELPDFDVSLRSAVSIARRLQDPMAELVKIEPKAIGVGQYQHDMPPARLDEALAGVVEDCVNSVGVDVNTASPSLLGYVAGLSAATAKHMCLHREQNGAFTSRAQFKKVKGLGPKAFEQCAGFLRIPGAKEPLDNTAVHPESYAAAGKLLALFGFDRHAVGKALPADFAEHVKRYGEVRAAEACGVGVPTLRDMIAELLRPGRDLRDSLPAPMLREDVMSMKDLRPGMELMGTARNVVDFGVFVDIGVHQDGLVHISRMADRFVRHPSELVRAGDVLKVWVVEADENKKRISLSMLRPV